jgi:hypothetical protein
MAKGFEALYGRKPVAGVDFDPDKGMEQDDYEYFTGTGQYAPVPAKCLMCGWQGNAPYLDGDVSSDCPSCSAVSLVAYEA